MQFTDSSLAREVLGCRNLGKSYRSGHEQLQILQGLELSVSEGETIAIMGSSGSGKSTLLNLMGGLDTADEGEVIVAGQTLSGLNEDELASLRNHRLGFVYQFHHPLPEFTALENVAMPLILRGHSIVKAKAEAAPLLDCVGLSKRTDHRPSQLSGGERQRVAIARALVTRPACLLMDEPTGNLDSDNADQVLELILQMNRDFRVAALLVTHDTRVASRMSRRCQLESGALVSL